MSKVFEDGQTPVAVLKDVNCTVEQGEVISVIGPSGTGKTTFLRCLNRLEEATSGEILIDGENILDARANLPKIRRKMGMVFQNFNLFENMNVLQNISDAPHTLLGVPKKEAENRAMELLELVGLTDKADAMPSTLSGGQKQRVAIARAVAMDPEIILFDEPTSALDPTMVGEVLSVIKKLAKAGMTMIIVTHEMKFARNVSTRIFFMNEGIIYEDGTPDQIFEHPQRPDTQAFIKRLRCLEFDVPDRKFDIHSMNGQIESFCGKYFLSDAVQYRIQSSFEELIMQILPLNAPAHLKVEYSEQSEDVSAEVIQESCCVPILDGESIPVTMVKGYVEEFSEETAGESRVLKMKYRK